MITEQRAEKHKNYNSFKRTSLVKSEFFVKQGNRRHFFFFFLSWNNKPEL